MRKRDLLLCVVLLGIIAYIMTRNDDTHGVKKYDCTISEISPDYPVSVKEACRRIRAERKKENE